MSYAVIIGVYKGGRWLSRIVEACVNQTVPPDKIFVWMNWNKDLEYIFPVMYAEIESRYGKKCDIERIVDFGNHGVYSRFTAAFIHNYDRYLVLDDDTIPGIKFVENCYNTIDCIGNNSIIGYRGIRLKPDALYDVDAYEKGTTSITEVDLCGHAWFVTRQQILAMFEDIPVNYFNGEDTHISAINQIKYGTRTYIPQQLISEPQTWGSTMQHLGAQAGRLSTSLGPQEHFEQRKRVNEHWISKGWTPLFSRS